MNSRLSNQSTSIDPAGPGPPVLTNGGELAGQTLLASACCLQRHTAAQRCCARVAVVTGVAVAATGSAAATRGWAVAAAPYGCTAYWGRSPCKGTLRTSCWQVVCADCAGSDVAWQGLHVASVAVSSWCPSAPMGTSLQAAERALIGKMGSCAAHMCWQRHFHGAFELPPDHTQCRRAA